MARLTVTEMDELCLSKKERIKYEYYSYDAVVSIKGLEKISYKELRVLLDEFKKVVINNSPNYNRVNPILELVRGKHDGYENPNWWAGVIFDECDRRYQMWSDEEVELNDDDEDIIHYLVINDGWRSAIR